jgi:hypothetical protein
MAFKQFHDANLVLVQCFAYSFLLSWIDLPPEFLFDAQVDVPATLTANMATFQGAPQASDLLQRWMRYASARLEPDGRIAVIWVAEYVELTIWGTDLEGERASSDRSTGRGGS